VQRPSGVLGELIGLALQEARWPDRRSLGPGVGDEGSTPSLTSEQPFSNELIERLTDREAGNTDLLHELRLGWERDAGTNLAAEDRGAQLLL
jgi:hypothetical protein